MSKLMKFAVELMLVFLYFEQNLKTSMAAVTSNPGVINKYEGLRCMDTHGNSNKTYCAKLANYPDISHLDTIIQRDYSQFFDDGPPIPNEITQRMFTEPGEEEICAINATLIYPETALSKDNIQMIIVNNEKFQQGVQIEECLNEYRECNTLGGLSNRYKSTCKQGHMFVPLIALMDINTVVRDFFKIPSCCSCIVKQIRN